MHRSSNTVVYYLLLLFPGSVFGQYFIPGELSQVIGFQASQASSCIDYANTCQLTKTSELQLHSLKAFFGGILSTKYKVAVYPSKIKAAESSVVKY
jgi:hypothetical protein